MRHLPILFYVLFAFGRLQGQGPAWRPAAGHVQIPIWPGEVPDARPAAGPEGNITTGKDRVVAGQPVFRIGNVVSPTITLYSPQSGNTGVAAVVFPGGGYSHLSIDIEGTEVCDWLNTAGISCILLKYRVPGSGPYPKSPAALEDAQRTLGLVRSHAAEWRINSQRVGVIGFSAGAHLAAALSTHFEQRLYKPVDDADTLICRPDFAVIVYPGYLATADPNLAVNPDLRIAGEHPPAFLVQTEDDRTARVASSLAYYVALKKANVPVEMHLYAEGVHGYGMRRTGLPVAGWPQLVETWLHTIRMLPG